jgi:hypothetical protein
VGQDSGSCQLLHTWSPAPVTTLFPLCLAAVIRKLNRNHVLDIIFWESFFCCFCEETIIHQHCSHICKTKNTHTFCEKNHTYFHFPSLFSSSSSSCEKRLDSSKSVAVFQVCSKPESKVHITSNQAATLLLVEYLSSLNSDSCTT